MRPLAIRQAARDTIALTGKSRTGGVKILLAALAGIAALAVAVGAPLLAAPLAPGSGLAWRHPFLLWTCVALALVAPWLMWLQLRRQRKRENGWFERLRDREERLKLALWASGEQFWDYDFDRDELKRMRVREDIADPAEITVDTDVQANHRIHPDDLPLVRERLRRHL